MNQHLQQLVDLSKIDKTIDAFEPKIEAINAKVSTINTQKATIEASIVALENDIQEANQKRKKNELHLAELSDKLKENSAKSKEVKNEREMKSLQLEEEIAKEQITFANEEIERLDGMIENRQVEIDKEKAALEALNSSSQEIEKEVGDALAVIDKERQEVFDQKQELVGKMNQKGLVFYEKIRVWAKNTTAVPVKKQACYGCFMKLNDKVYAEVLTGEDVITCPHCGRILYSEPEDVPEA